MRVCEQAIWELNQPSSDRQICAQFALTHVSWRVTYPRLDMVWRRGDVGQTQDAHDRPRRVLAIAVIVAVFLGPSARACLRAHAAHLDSGSNACGMDRLTVGFSAAMVEYAADSSSVPPMLQLAQRRSCPAQKPSIFRFLSCTVALWLVAGACAAEDALTEQAVVQRAVDRPALRDALQGRITTEAGRARTRGAYPNPQLSYMREQTFGALGTGEDYLSIAQPIDLANRRGLASEAGTARTLATRSDAEARRRSVIAEARERFYAALYRQERVAALARWASQIDEALDIVMRRERRGDAAAYDRRRLEREHAVALAKQASELALLDRASAEVVAIAGLTTPLPTLSGTLLPDATIAELSTLQARARSRPELRALDLQVEAAEHERMAAARGWIPDLRLEAGWKGVQPQRAARSDGFLLAASLALPLWDRSTGAKQAAEGEALAARGESGLLEAELLSELAGARAEALRLHQAASELLEKAGSASRDLLRIAAAGYEGGELGLLELLDAYRGAAEDSLLLLDMAHAARSARIALDRMTGANVP
jgi:outer membrane protein, heavy metal efflux system